MTSEQTRVPLACLESRLPLPFDGTNDLEVLFILVLTHLNHVRNFTLGNVTGREGVSKPGSRFSETS